MAMEFDASDFVDSDFQTAQKAVRNVVATAPAATFASARPPTREELDSKVGETQLKLVELKRAQEELERARAALEEARRRQTEFLTGRDEMVQHLTRGVGLIEEAEFTARSEAEQMAKALGGLREAMSKVTSIHEETWNKENYNAELSRALTTIENARMEWNSARLKWPRLFDNNNSVDPLAETGKLRGQALWGGMDFKEQCRVGLALTWPLAAVALLAVMVFLVAILRH
jgi:hypothetical protein